MLCDEIISFGCDICFELLKQAKLLNCGHTLCLKCCQDKIEKGYIQCIQCSLRTRCNDAKKLRTNFNLQGAIEELERKQRKIEQKLLKSNASTPVVSLPVVASAVVNPSAATAAMRPEASYMCLSKNVLDVEFSDENRTQPVPLAQRDMPSTSGGFAPKRSP